MDTEHIVIGLGSLNAPIPDMAKWTIQGLRRYYRRSRSWDNKEAVCKELHKRGYISEAINNMLTTKQG